MQERLGKLNHEESLFVSFSGLWPLFGSLEGSPYAQEMLGGEPREFHVAILSNGKVTFILPSTIVIDEKVKLKPLELIVTNETREKHGFAIDTLQVKGGLGRQKPLRSPSPSLIH
jgi:hypothetical protein